MKQLPRGSGNLTKVHAVGGWLAAVVGIVVLGELPSKPEVRIQQNDAAFLGARTRGDPEAPITVFEASDFQCPFCRDFWAETLPILEKEYIQTGKVQFIFVNFPLTQIHPNAAAAHEFAMCAAAQRRFWEVHDLLYRYQAQWVELEQPASFFFTLADSAGLSRATLQGCFDSGAVRQLILQEAQAAWQAGIRSTPSFVIEGGLLAGARPIDVWRPILDSLFVVKTGK